MQSFLNNNSLLFLLLPFLMVTSTNVNAQKEYNSDPEESYLYVIKKRWQHKDFGKQVIQVMGTPEKETKDSLWINVIGESIGYKKTEVRSIKAWEYKGRFDVPDRNTARHFFSPTARNLKKGEAYYQNILIGGQTVNYGIIDNISIGFGFEGITFALEQELTWFVHPKFSTMTESGLDFGFGVMVSGMHYWAFEELDRLIVVPYMNMTIGSVDYNVTAGIGHGFDWDRRFSRIPAGLLGTKLRITNSLSFTSENVLFNIKKEGRDPQAFYGGLHGIQWSVRRFTVDLAFLYIHEQGDSAFAAAPYLGFAFYL